MEFTAAQIAHILQGTVIGNADEKVSTVSRIEDAQKGSITFLSNPQYTPFIYSTNAGIVIVNKSFVPEEGRAINSTLIAVENAYSALATLLEYYSKINKPQPQVEQPSFIASSAKTGKDIYIGAFAYIGNNASIEDGAYIYPHAYIGDGVSIGKNTVINPGVKIYAHSKIGNNCIIHAGAVIGSDGFGFAPNSENNYQKVPQIGNVIIEDHVEIGANTTIDRASIGSTIIRKGAKLDNLIQIAHNVDIGENTVIAGQTGVAGSTKIGKDCMIGGQVGIVGHIQIADKVKIAAQSGIGSSITNEGEIVQGSPAFGIGDYKKSYVMFRKLPSIEARIREIEKNNS
jgi:UDP-3-O-[3-hydroxymyristoyl] glucosamine N-acyltransferase